MMRKLLKIKNRKKDLPFADISELYCEIGDYKLPPFLMKLQKSSY